MFLEYINILIFIIISTLISIIIILASYILIFQNNDSEKIKAYECGFQPFEDTRQKFDIRFYLVSILFVIFDLEIMFLFPWCLVLYSVNFFSFFVMFLFLFILTIGFVYEWKKGALDWE